MATKIKNLKKKVLALLPKRVTLVDIDYRDSIEDWDAINNAVRDNDWQPLDDLVYNGDWFGDAQWESIKYLKGELKDDIQREFEIDEDEAEEIIERYDDDIRDLCYDRDDSTPMKDLLKNTGDMPFFYDTGEEFEGYTHSAAQYRLDRIRIKKLLNIKTSDNDNEIDEVLANAGYGGRLVIYFTASADELIHPDKSHNIITFDDPYIAIVDHLNGSGHHAQLGHSCTLPFNSRNLFLDKAVSYSYTFDVCGMSRDWCAGTKWELGNIEGVTLPDESSISRHMEQQARYEKTYREGGCTPLDMKYTRHRNVKYINNFPCGSHCMDCGTFWID